MKALPPVEYLRERLAYEPATGILTWKNYSGRSAQWNGRYADKKAFITDNGGGYLVGCIDGRTYLAHRVAYAIHYGIAPDGFIDHIDGSTANNKADNLRAVSQSDNLKNARRSTRNVSGVTGVHWAARRNEWVAKITTHQKTYHIGCFQNFEDAVAARKSAEMCFGFHANHGRTVGDDA